MHLSHLYDPDKHFQHLTVEYNLSPVTIPVHNWRDTANDLVHMQLYSDVFKPNTLIYVELKVHVFNIIKTGQNDPVTQPACIGSIIIQKIRVLPTDEDDVQLLHIDATVQQKEKEDHKREEHCMAEEHHQQLFKKEQKCVAEHNTKLAVESEKKKRKLDIARTKVSSVTPTPTVIPVASTSTAPVTTSVPHNASGHCQVIGAQMSTGSKPPPMVIHSHVQAEKQHASNDPEHDATQPVTEMIVDNE
ncbi:hypothetical protein GYMLUDRAFT_61861 [Collybiopsis luxurians FD-317 M1]|uniref:Uncharacterized protein n=1 Tax=Collybiopsis luxurians FD-317 M1 TaxID=944289 RepID=A0A0D0CEW7_9AGAR|nr:hypothetical protein GYMLUDRAFT_61861 [Collybiopsis luxurians FD-317 M1]